MLDNLVSEIKYNLSILGYVLVIYPIKRFIFPMFSILIHESYMLTLLAIFYILMYLYDFDIQRIATDFSTKLVNEDIEGIIWFLSPIVTIGFIQISPAHLLLACMATFLIVRLYRVGRLLFRQFKMIAGDLLIVLLWVYFRIVGNKEQSVMLITSEEVKHKIAMYAIIIVVILLSLLLVIMPNLMANHIMPINVPSQIILNNTSIETPEYVSQLVIP